MGFSQVKTKLEQILGIDLSKGRKYPIGHISHRKDGDYKKVKSTGDAQEDWVKLSGEKPSKSKHSNKKPKEKVDKTDNDNYINDDRKDKKVKGKEARDGKTRKKTNRSGSGSGRHRAKSDRGVRDRKDDGKIITARSEISQRPKKRHIPKSLSRYVKILYPHQQDAVNLALEKYSEGYQSFLLADGTGTGKTFQQLALAGVMSKKKKSSLIITDSKQIINDAFMKDAEVLDLDIEYCTKPPKKIKKGKVYITTYSRLKNFQNSKFGFLSFDEAHNLKNKTSAKTKYGMSMMDKADHVCLATATPMDKGAHVQYVCKAFNLPTGQTLRDLGYHLVKRWAGKRRGNILVWEKDPDLTNEERALRIEQFYNGLTRDGLMLKREVPLDNLSVGMVDVELTKEQKSQYDTLYRELAGCIPKYRAVHLMKLRRFLESCKVDGIVEKAVNDIKNGRKAVIFTEYVNATDSSVGDDDDGFEIEGTIDMVAERLEKEGIEFVTLTGETTKRQAEKNMDEFNNGDAMAFITTVKSGGTGINLDDRTGKSPRSAYFLTPPFSANEVLQGLGRINRLTTVSEAEAYFAYTNTEIDQWNKAIVVDKMQVLNASVQGGYKGLKLDDLPNYEHMSRADILEHFMSKGEKPRPVPVGTPRDKKSTLKPREPVVRPKGEKAKYVPVHIDYKDKDEAKQLGARWDRYKKRWTVPEDQKDRFAHLMKDYVPIPIPYKKKDKAKKLGAKWDAANKTWMCEKGRESEFKHLFKSLALAVKGLLFDILKGRALPEGTIRTHGGVKKIKKNGKWVKYTGK